MQRIANKIEVPLIGSNLFIRHLDTDQLQPSWLKETGLSNEEYKSRLNAISIAIPLIFKQTWILLYILACVIIGILSPFGASAVLSLLAIIVSLAAIIYMIYAYFAIRKSKETFRKMEHDWSTHTVSWQIDIM
jgi:hypothetical protein